MKKVLILLVLSLFINPNLFGKTDKKKKYVPIPNKGTKEWVEVICPEFNDGKNNCIEDLNTALKYSFRITETYKEDKYVIYMLRKMNKIAMCKVKTKNAPEGATCGVPLCGFLAGSSACVFVFIFDELTGLMIMLQPPWKKSGVFENRLTTKFNQN